MVRTFGRCENITFHLHRERSTDDLQKSPASIFSEANDTLRIRMTRPGAALGGCCGISKVALFGIRESDDAVDDKTPFAIREKSSSAMFRFESGQCPSRVGTS